MVKKSYNTYVQFCKENVITKEEITASKFYQFLINDLKLLPDQTLLIANIQSLALKSDPSRLRIRSDQFLKLVKAQQTGALITGIKINNQKYFCFFSTKYFFNYHFNVNQSNSFITFTYQDLINNYTIYDNDGIIEKTTKTNGKIYFYVSVNDHFNPQLFTAFNKTIKSIPDLSIQNKTTITFIPPIADVIKKRIRALNQDWCALVFNDQNNLYHCPCQKAIDIAFLKANNLNYTDLHHFAPKDFLANFFKKQNKDINWNIIHDEINLVPLCTPCHSAIHKGKNNPKLVTSVFQAIIKSYQITNRYNRFIKYLDQNFKMKIQDLLNLYLKIFSFKQQQED